MKISLQRRNHHFLSKISWEAAALWKELWFTFCKIPVMLNGVLPVQHCIILCTFLLLVSLLCSSERLVSLIFKEFHDSKTYFTHNFRNGSLEFRFSTAHPSLACWIRAFQNISACTKILTSTITSHLCTTTQISHYLAKLLFLQSSKNLLQKTLIDLFLPFWKDNIILKMIQFYAKVNVNSYYEKQLPKPKFVVEFQALNMFQKILLFRHLYLEYIYTYSYIYIHTGWLLACWYN